VLKIAVCDDIPEELESICGLVKSWAEARREADAACMTFSSSDSLLDHISANGFFDIYLLDVLMPGMDGIELGRAIRATGDKGAIVYITSSPDFAVQSYEIRAFHYLLKPVGREAIFEILDRIADGSLLDNKTVVSVSTPGGVTPVPMDNLLYVELRNHIAVFNLADGRSVSSVTLRTSFDDVAAPLLSDSRFLKVGASYVVNLSFVESLSGRYFLLPGPTQIAIPRASVNAVKNAYLDYLIERGRGLSQWFPNL